MWYSCPAENITDVPDSKCDTILEMALKSAGISVLRYRLSAGLEYQVEFPWNFSFYQSLD